MWIWTVLAWSTILWSIALAVWAIRIRRRTSLSAVVRWVPWIVLCLWLLPLLWGAWVYFSRPAMPGEHAGGSSARLHYAVAAAANTAAVAFLVVIPPLTAAFFAARARTREAAGT